MTEHRQHSIHIHMSIMWHKNRPIHIAQIPIRSPHGMSISAYCPLTQSDSPSYPTTSAVLPTLTVQYNPSLSLSHIRIVSTIDDFESTQNASIIQR